MAVHHPIRPTDVKIGSYILRATENSSQQKCLDQDLHSVFVAPCDGTLSQQWDIITGSLRGPNQSFAFQPAGQVFTTDLKMSPQSQRFYLTRLFTSD